MWMDINYMLHVRIKSLPSPLMSHNYDATSESDCDTHIICTTNICSSDVVEAVHVVLLFLQTVSSSDNPVVREK